MFVWLFINIDLDQTVKHSWKLIKFYIIYFALNIGNDYVNYD